MPKIVYATKKFRSDTLDVIETANRIITDYAQQGFDLTLRQLFYQFVARDLIPNTQKAYKNLGSVISDARLAGMIDWEHITDRTRTVRRLAHWDNPSQILEASAQQFRFDKWLSQDNRVEVWIEKDALVGVLERVCNRLDVSYLSCRGYYSMSAMWKAAQRIIEYGEDGQGTVILHLGDHDPSGLDMTRDIEERLQLFGAIANVKRIALNMDQIQQYGPPPNPAKTTDSRSQGYIEQFGNESWELDALDPQVIVQLVESHVVRYRDDQQWRAETEREQEARDKLRRVAEGWEEIDA